MHNVDKAWLSAILVASLVPALSTLMAGPLAILAFPIMFVTAFLTAAAHVVLLAMPLHYLLSRRGPPGVAATLIGGFTVGALPSFVLIFFMDPLSGALRGDASLPEALEQGAAYFLMPLIFGFCGFAGALAFWVNAARDAEV
jgi:hypothetical protein